jgi:hypothetical protein
LTFSTEFVKDPNTRTTVSNAIDVCMKEGFMDQIIALDEVCANKNERCPYTWNIVVDVLPFRKCYAPIFKFYSLASVTWLFLFG